MSSCSPPRCLLAVVALCWAAAVPAQQFRTVLAPAGIHGLLPTMAPDGTGACVADFDGDGDVDVVLSDWPGQPFRYFRNDGGMMFTDRTANCGLGVSGIVQVMSAADVDNDGRVDLFVGNSGSPGELYINLGGGQFSAEAVARGIYNVDSNYAACFGDFDRDGWLDLYLGNRLTTGSVPAPNRLFRNTGGGHFVDVTATAGVAGNAMTLAATWLDYDEDGWPDLIEVNDKGATWGANELYRNNGNGTFTPVGAALHANNAIDGMGVDFTDVFHDGGVDYYCTDVPTTHLFQLWDPLVARYTNATATYGLQGGGTGWACNFFDVDNDGWQDLHVVHSETPNVLFKNPGAPAAAGVAWPQVAGAYNVADNYSQYVALVADFDDDGKLDLLSRFSLGLSPSPSGVVIRRNDVASGNWLKLRLRGTVSNRDALGARVEVHASGRVQRQWVRNGVGYLSQSDSRLHFGLGAVGSVPRIDVTWPSGQVQHLTNVSANQILEVVEPRMQLSAPAQIGAVTALELDVPGDQGLPYLMFLSLTNATTTLSDGSVLPVGIDGLSLLTAQPGNPLLPGCIGALDAQGHASSALAIPPLPWLSGLTFYATGLTVDQANFTLVRTFFPRAIAVTL